MAQDILTWSDFKVVLSQLKLPAIKEKFKTITIDTIAILWELCEAYICSQNQVTKIADISWGGGYAMCKKEFESAIRQITLLGYGLICIAHVEKRTQAIDDKNSIEIYTPALAKRPYAIINQLVDVIGYINPEYDENGVMSKRTLCTRSTSTVLAGSRFKHLPPYIPFGYDELVSALSDALEVGKASDGDVLVEKTIHIENVSRTFTEVREEALGIFNTLVAKDDKAGTNDQAKAIQQIVTNVFGIQKRLSEITEDEVDLFELVIVEMKKML